MTGRQVLMADDIKKAYSASKNIYDDTLTQSKWWSRLYINLFWGGINDNEIAGLVLDMIPPDFEGRLLDVPAGTGVFTAEKYASLPKADIVCLDYSEDMLAQAKKRFRSVSAENISCMQGDVGDLPFENESFDIVLSMNGFHAFPDKNKAFYETHRILKKGGMFCGCFYIRNENSRTDFIVNRLLAKKGWFTPPFQTSDELSEKLSALYSSSQLQNQQAEAYFRCTK